MLNMTVNEDTYALYLVILTAGYLASDRTKTENVGDCAKDVLENVLGIYKQEPR